MWLVIQESIPATEKEISAFERMLDDSNYKDGNTRKLQAVGERSILMRKLPDSALNLVLSATISLIAIPFI